MCTAALHSTWVAFQKLIWDRCEEHSTRSTSPDKRLSPSTSCHQARPEKNFVKALNKGGADFAYLREVFSIVSDTKLKGGIFAGSQMTMLMKDHLFDTCLKRTKWGHGWSWRTFVRVFWSVIAVVIMQTSLKNFWSHTSNLCATCPSRFILCTTISISSRQC